MSEIKSSRLSQSTAKEFNPKDEYQNYVYIKKEKNINLTKLELLKNRINNLKQRSKKT